MSNLAKLAEEHLKLRNALSAIISDARMTLPYGIEPWEKVHITRLIDRVESAMISNTKNLQESEE